MTALPLDDLKKDVYVHSPVLSPEGSALCYVTTRVNLDENKYESALWIRDIHTERTYQLTAYADAAQPVFIDERRILYRDKRKTSSTGTDFFVIPTDGGESTHAFHLQYSVDAIHPLGNHAYLALAMPIPTKKNSDKGCYTTDCVPFWSNGAGFIPKKRMGIYKISDNGNEILRLTKKKTEATCLHLNASGDKAVFISTTYDKLAPLVNDISLIDLETGDIKTLSTGKSHRYVNFYKDGLITLYANGTSHGLNEDPLIYTIDFEGNAEKITGDDFDMCFGNWVGTDSLMGSGQTIAVQGEDLYFIATVKNASNIYRLRNGEVTAITKTSGAVSAFDLCGNDLYYTAMDSHRLNEIYSLKSGQLSDHNAPRTISVPQPMTYESLGKTLTGYVLYPRDYDPHLTYPGILTIHGGPKTAFGTIYHHEMQVLASRGHFVFYTNPRGSCGHGVAYSDIRGKYGTIDYEDLMAFTDEVLDHHPAIDPQRLGVMGGSYGGYMTNWIIGHTNRFKAANAERSISNWLSFYGTSDIGWYFAQDQVGANPWDDASAMWNNSPLKYARNVSTPTLFIHSDCDYRCPLDQGLQMYQSLVENKVPSKLLVFHEENHELSRSGKPKNRLKRLKKIVKWFDKHLIGTSDD